MKENCVALTKPSYASKSAAEQQQKTYIRREELGKYARNNQEKEDCMEKMYSEQMLDRTQKK